MGDYHSTIDLQKLKFFYQREFTFLLVPLLSRKLKKTIPLLLKHPSLLAHTIYQTLLFDSALAKDGFSLQGTSSSESGAEWAGISEIILGNSEWFETWLAGEKDCKFLPSWISHKSIYTNTVVDDQYNEIISSGDAWLVAEGVNGDDALHDLKPTNSSRRIKSLVEQVTGQLTLILFLHQLSDWSRPLLSTSSRGSESIISH